jgi:hypothetical protein
MDVVSVWPDCEFLHGAWSRERRTSDWVRVPRAEIPSVLKHASDGQALAAAIETAMEGDEVYLLVSEDLDSIVALPSYYPESGQWNGMSPFVPIDHWAIDDLDALAEGPPAAS